MNSISISELKANPSKMIEKAIETPVAVQKRNKVKAYLVGTELFEKIISTIEDKIDVAYATKTNFSKGRDFDEIAEELGI